MIFLDGRWKCFFGPPFNSGPMDFLGKKSNDKKNEDGRDALVLAPTLNVPEMLCNFGMFIVPHYILGDADNPLLSIHHGVCFGLLVRGAMILDSAWSPKPLQRYP